MDRAAMLQALDEARRAEAHGDVPVGAVVVRDNILERDGWSLRPLDRKDMLLPFEVPKDIPPAVWPPREEPFPLRYAMHCHTEMSQTAGGGNYPQGLVTHWELLGPTRPTTTA
jgi:tRNA(Arg) A34 adenosine deaminase TadA